MTTRRDGAAAGSSLGIGLGDIDQSLRYLYLALSGRLAEVLAAEELEEGLDPADTHDTIRLPARVALFERAADNRGWYRLAIAHRAGHYRYSSFELDLSEVLARLGLSPDALEVDLPREDRSDWRATHAWSGYYSMFGRPELALRVFGAVEDFRIDTRLVAFAPGCVEDLRRAAQAELSSRQPISELAPRSQGLELLMRMTLWASGEVEVSAEVAAVAHDVACLLAAVADDRATVVDSAAVAAAIYLLLDQLPATHLEQRVITLSPVVARDPMALRAEIADRCLGALPEARIGGFEGEVRLAASVKPVGYRDLLGMRYRGISAGTTGVHQELLLLTEKTGASHEGHDHGPQEHQHHDEPQEHDHLGPPEPMPHEHHDIPDLYYRRRRLPSRGDGHGYHYPEWDYLSRCYLPGWTTVREEIPRRGEHVDALLRRLAALAPTSRELGVDLRSLVSEGRKIVHRVRDGDEVDFDGSVDALVELRGGSGGEPRPYQRLERTRRDVAVGIVLDLSSSTADLALPVTIGGRHDNGSRQGERLLDREVEAVALLAQSLAQLGDQFAIYGFSGTGRHDVRVLVVKELRERPSLRVLERMSGLVPLHMTRLAPVVRHVTRKLAREPAATKLLVVVCDGRPLDVDYGDQHGEEAKVDYALADTRAAIDEAREQHVYPFIVGIDGAGREYLSDMLGDEGSYEVVADVAELPAALLRVYRRLRLVGGEFVGR